MLHPAFLAGIEDRTARAVRGAARVITPSESSRRDVVALYDLDATRVHVVPYGVDATFAAGAPRGVPAVQGPYVLFAAMLHPRKNLAALRGPWPSSPSKVSITGSWWPAGPPRTGQT